ncbi:hypothetical protein [Polaromonas aquatica]|uniref:hypothetical protein n=1 Tax=Polaromonas aquatica TaxID=332657 RepID=UPI003D6608FB
MAFLGQAAVAMWWNMAAEHREEFEHWHSHEHFPERMGIPGFLRGSRWSSVDSAEGFFVLYELENYEVLTSPGYRERLNNPTPWSTKMMPHHQDMVRSQCRLLHSSGGGIGGHALTLRLSPAEGRDAELLKHFSAMGASFASQPGGVAFHVLRTETPQAASTKEQQIRGGKDKAADWIVVAIAYEASALDALQRETLGEEIERHGALPGALAGRYQLACAASANDLK